MKKEYKGAAMNFLKKISVFIVFLSFINICLAGEAPRGIIERPQEPTTPSARDTLELEGKRNLEIDKQEKEKQLTNEKDPAKRAELSDELRIIDNQQKYIKSLIETFDAKERLKINSNDPAAKKTIRDNKEARKFLDEQLQILSEAIQKGYIPADGETTNQPSLVSKLVEAIFSPIQNFIKKFNVKRELQPEQAKKTLDKTIKQSTTIGGGPIESPEKIQFSLKQKSVADQLDLWITAYNRPENVGVQKLYKDFITDYITKLENADIEYTLQNKKDPEAIQRHHEEIVNALRAIGIDQAQIDALNKYKDDAVNKIKTTFSTQDKINRVNKFFDATSADNFSLEQYNKLADATNKLDTNSPEQLKTMIANVETLNAIVDELNDYATYSLDSLPQDIRTKMLEFVTNEQNFLINCYEDIIQAKLLGTLVTEEKVKDLLRKLKRNQAYLRKTEQLLQDVGEKNLIANQKRLEVQELIKKNMDAKPLNDPFLKLANETIPSGISEFSKLLREIHLQLIPKINLQLLQER